MPIDEYLREFLTLSKKKRSDTMMHSPQPPGSHGNSRPNTPTSPQPSLVDSNASLNRKEALKARGIQQGRITKQLTKIDNKLRSEARPEFIQGLMDHLTQLVSTFEERHDEVLRYTEEEDVAEIETQEIRRDDVMERVESFQERVQEYLQRQKEKKEKEKPRKPKMPDFELKRFEGDIKEWKSLRSIYSHD
jgi:hypothetical protein